MAKKESTLLNMVLTLFLVTTAAGLALALVYNTTLEPIKEVEENKLETALGRVLPDFDKIEPQAGIEVMPQDGKDPLVFYPAYKGEEHVGTAVKTYTDQGFSGRFCIMVGFKPDVTIINTAVLEHKETPGLGDKMEAEKSDFPSQFKGKNPADFALSVTKDGGDVDAITAATISSRAFCDAVDRAYKTFINENKGGTK
ncbi:MAG: RnfABCDGE type electron transport complex subunit G [Bacteroidota bacterium]|nr:RnfABCDGE type electron transport complex subunit G [Bacteroidota bacterium]